MRRKWTDKQLVGAVKNSNSICGVIAILKLNFSGGIHASIKKRIEQLNLDTSHFTGKGWCKGEKHQNFVENFIEYPLEKILVKNSNYKNLNNLKKKIIRAKILEDKCYGCGIVNWLDREIKLKIHHIDGDKSNNSIENLTILCPNCRETRK